LTAYQADIAHYDGTDTQILGISVDASPSNRRFAEDLHLTFPLLSDFKRNVSTQYGILDEQKSLAVRTTFLVDKDGIVRYVEQGSEAIDPSNVSAECARLPKK
jgi:peroxiredoxin (alkyl hydroperoxide reductase subunit C)